MYRVVEQLKLVKLDMNDTIADKLIENSVFESIVSECEDEFEVAFTKRCIEENREIIEESKKVLFDIDEVVELLKSIKKDPSLAAKESIQYSHCIK